MSASKKFKSGCCCKRASSIGGGSGTGGGGLGTELWELRNGHVATVGNRSVRVENTISSIVLEIDSDKRLKTNIVPLTAASPETEALFNNVKAKKFVYKKTPTDTHYGFIAQDIQKAENGLENLVTPNKETGYYGFRMLEIIPLLFVKIQQLEERIKQLEK